MHWVPGAPTPPTTLTNSRYGKMSLGRKQITSFCSLLFWKEAWRNPKKQIQEWGTNHTGSKKTRQLPKTKGNWTRQMFKYVFRNVCYLPPPPLFKSILVNWPPMGGTGLAGFRFHHQQHQNNTRQKHGSSVLPESCMDQGYPGAWLQAIPEQPRFHTEEEIVTFSMCSLGPV